LRLAKEEMAKIEAEIKKLEALFEAKVQERAAL